MHIIFERYNAGEFENTLVFTSQRLSQVSIEKLPERVDVVELEWNDKRSYKDTLATILKDPFENLFVFTAYRDLETHLLCAADRSVKRHLVQDGANFYFKERRSVALSRIRETLRIYRNLWRAGILFFRPVVYTKHMAACSFIDCVWLTDPGIYEQPRFFKRPVNKIVLFEDTDLASCLYQYFAADEIPQMSNGLIYLATLQSSREKILAEVAHLKMVLESLSVRDVIIKLHPNAPSAQVELFIAEFGNLVVRNFIPAELYIARAKTSIVIGTASAALFYNNASCKYFSLIRPYQSLGIFARSIDVALPPHVTVVESGHVWKSQTVGTES